MKKKFIKLQSIFLVIAMLMSMIIPAASIHAFAAATHAIDICYEDGSSVTEQISLMESEQLQLTHKLLDCSMPDGAYLKWTSESPLIVSVDSTGKIYAHDSSKGAAVRLWIDNDVRTVAIIGPALAVAMEKLLFNDNIDLDTMDTEAILETVRSSLSGVSSTVADYLVKQLEKRLNSLDTGITVTLYSADGKVLASDQVRVLVTNSDKWYASIIPNGAFITNKESLPTTVAVGGKLKLEGGVTPLRLGYGVTWSIDTDSIWTSGSDYASMDENGNITFLKEGKVTVKVSPNANDLVDSLMKYINDAISLGKDVDTAQLAAIMIKLLGLNISQNALKAVLDILVTVAKIGNNSSDLLATAIKTLSNYLLKASINDSITFTIVQSLELEKFELTAEKTELTEGDTTMVSLTDIVPAGANSQNVIWSSSDESVISVNENGIVKARDAGGASSLNKKTATVTATVDGGFTAECKVTVVTNKDSLAAAISAVTNAALVEDEYTVESYDALKNAYNKATELYNDENASQADIDSITAALNNAFSSLKRLIKPEAVFIQYDGRDASEYISKEVNLSTSFKYQNNSIKLDSRISPLDSMYKTVEWTSSTSDIEVNESGECSPTVNKACYGVITLTVTDERGRSVSDSVNVSFARYPVTKITITPEEINDPLDAQPQKLSAKCQSESALITYDATIQDIIWSSDNPSAVSVDENGQLTYNDAGVATITATSCDGGITATCVVTVGGDKTALRAAILRADEANIDIQEYTYETSTEYTAAYNHAKEVEAGTVYSQEEIDTAAKRLNDALDNLKPYIHMEKLNIYYNGETAPKFIAVKVPIYKTYTSQSVELSYDYAPSNAMYESITWSSDNEAVAVSESGKVSPAKNSACGACITLTATDHYGNTVENSVYVSFANNPVSSIELDKTSIEVAYGAEPQTLTATLKSDRLVGDKPSVSDVVWTTSDSDVATVDNGTVTFVEAGTCIITASSVDGGYSATCTVTVKSDKTELTKTKAMMAGLALNSEDYTDESWAVFAAAMEKAENILLADNPKQRDINAANEELLNAYDSLVRYIRLEKIYITLDGSEAQEHISVNVPVTSKYTDKSVTLSYVLVPEDATINSVTWESSNSSVTVEDGVVKPAENKACYSIITVKATDYKGKEFTDSVYVSFANVPVTGIKLDKTEISDATVGGSDKITATVQPTGTLGIGAANIQDVIWESSDTSVATVDGGNLSFVDTGSCTVTATTVDGGFTASVNIKVFADKSKLSAKAEEASQLKETDYTPATWAELKTALDEAKKVLEMSDPTQTAVNEALALLESKIASLEDYVYVKGIDITYNNTVSDVYTVIVPEDQTYIMTTAQLGFKTEPENAMFVSSEWSFEGDIYVNINGIAVPKVNTACYGKVIIKLTDDFGNVYTKEVTIVFAKNPAATISVTPSEVTTHVIGEEIQLTASVLGANGNASDLDKVTWSSSDSSIASVDENGLVKIISGGTAIITAKTVIGGLSAACVITVATDKTALQKAIYDAENPGYNEQDYTKETYAVFVETLKKAKDIYADESVSQAEIDDAAAKLTSAVGALKKYIHMSAITIKHNGSDAPEFISVKVPVYKSYTSQSVSLSYDYSPDDSMYESIVWSSDSSLVSVDENGTVSPAENKACAAKITVTATDHFGNKVTDSIYVSFANTPATGVSLDKTQISGAPGTSEVLTATVEPKGKLGIGGANITDVIWKTSDPSVATVENGTVTFIDGGTATITVYTLDGGHTAQCTVTVTVTKDALLKAINDAEAIDLSLRTKETADALKEAITAAKAVYGNASATSAQVSGAISKLKEASDALKYLDGDYTEVNAAIEKYKAIDKSKYTEDSYNALKNAAERVTYGLDITHQSEIDKMAKDINAAIASLVKIETAVIKPIFDGTTVDNENMLIYGVEASISSLDKYIEAVDGTIKCTETANGLGTGTVIELCNEDGNVIKTYKLVIFGDVNGDGLYDAQDAFIVDCIINGLLTREKVGEAVWLAADCNHDGKINADDRALLEQAGLLLSKVDQSKSKQELEADEAYTEYTELISQSVENTDNSAYEEILHTDYFKSIIEFVLNFISKIIIGMR